MLGSILSANADDGRVLACLEGISPCRCDWQTEILQELMEGDDNSPTNNNSLLKFLSVTRTFDAEAVDEIYGTSDTRNNNRSGRNVPCEATSKIQAFKTHPPVFNNEAQPRDFGAFNHTPMECNYKCRLSEDCDYWMTKEQERQDGTSYTACLGFSEGDIDSDRWQYNPDVDRKDNDLIYAIGTPCIWQVNGANGFWWW